MSADVLGVASREEELQRRIAALEAELAQVRAQAALPATLNVNTEGGAAVQATVEVSNGDFVGRDAYVVQFIENQTVQGKDAEHTRLVLNGYLHALSLDLAHLPLGEIDAKLDQTRQTALEMEDVYVPPDTTFRIPEGVSLADAVRARDPGEGQADAKHGDAWGPMRAASVMEALVTHRCLTLLGLPGSGKSTFGHHVLLALAQAWLGRNRADALPAELCAEGPLLPVRVRLRRFAERHARTTEALHAGDLWSFIGAELHAAGWGDAENATRQLQHLGLKQGALVLFDGLDECGDEVRRQRVLAAVQGFMKSAGPKSRCLLTSRPYVFPRGADPAQGIYLLADLDKPKIETFIKRWYRTLVRRNWQRDEDARRKRDNLLAVYPRPDLLALATNPLLLTLMAIVHSNRGRLPDDRADLYDETVDLLLQRWNQRADRTPHDLPDIQGRKLGDLRVVLERVAYDMHEASLGQEGPAEIGEYRLVLAFAPLLQDSLDQARKVVEFIWHRTGLLLGLNECEGGERLFGFPHRTFQEFLAACHLASRSDFELACRRLAEQDAGHWRVVLALAARRAGPGRAAMAAEELVGGQEAQAALRTGQHPTPVDWQRVLTAGLQLQEVGPGLLALGHATRATLARVRGWLQAGLPLHPTEGGAPARQRVALGEVLAALGDPRFDPKRLHLPVDDMLGFVRIEADLGFCIGTHRADRSRIARVIGDNVDGREVNDEPTPTSAFYIARYPVTVAQFRAFVDATGRKPGDADALRDAASRPVRRVNWSEANAYCDWLHERLLHEPALAGSGAHELVFRHGWRVSLPSELEWEKAARGGLVNQVFSWGNDPDPERANVRESDIDDTCAVGCFPANGFGIHDMLGNVWEWTRLLWNAADGMSNDYPCRAGDSRFEVLDAEINIARLVRGGAWRSTNGVARCAFRGRIRPDVHNGNLGFRVVLRCAPVLER